MLSQLSVGVFMWQTLLPTCLQEQREECVHVLGENIHLMPLMEIIDSLILMQHFVLVLVFDSVCATDGFKHVLAISATYEKLKEHHWQCFCIVMENLAG